MNGQLKYLSDSALSQLRNRVAENPERYCGRGFSDYADDPGWDIPLEVEYDTELLGQLDPSKPQNVASIDLKNSKIVGIALAKLDPSTANEERIWVRLSHIEAFDYCKARWLDSVSGGALIPAIRKHFFAGTQTGIRDDHGLSRLWWNYYIASTCQPDDVDGALDLILASADIRSNFVERIWMTSRQRIAGAVLRAMKTEEWPTAAEKNFRDFMKAVNRLGGGIVFEALADDEADEFVSECVAFSKNG